MNKADLLRNYLNDNMVDPNDLKRDAEIYITDIAELFGVEFTDDENGWISTDFAKQSKPYVSEVKDKKETVKNCKFFYGLYSRNYPRLETLSNKGKEELYEYAVDFYISRNTKPDVSDEDIKDYAKFCVLCDRKGLKLLEFEDFIKLP